LKNVLQKKSLDLLPVFHYLSPVNLEQQEQVVGQRYQLEIGFIKPGCLNQQLANRHIILGSLDLTLTVALFLIEIDRFLGGQFCFGDKKGIGKLYVHRTLYPQKLQVSP
jgi:hypothetical protein